MHHHIIQDGRRSQHETPVKREGASGTAASPSGLLVAYGNTVVGTTGELLEVGGSFWKILLCGSDIALFQCGALGVGQIGDGAVLLLFLYFQIFRDDPDAFINEQVRDFFLRGAQGDANGNLPIGRDADRAAFAVAVDEGVGQFVELALVLYAYGVVAIIIHKNLTVRCITCRIVLIIL